MSPIPPEMPPTPDPANQQAALNADLGGASFADLTPERAAEIAAKVDQLTGDQVLAIAGRLDAARLQHVNYRTDVAAARMLVSQILSIATLVT